MERRPRRHDTREFKLGAAGLGLLAVRHRCGTDLLRVTTTVRSRYVRGVALR